MNKRRNAFTLVEILVVLAIIAILAALLFPAFNRARESAKQTNCASNLQQIGFAVAQYRKDEGRYPDSLLDLLAQDAKYDVTGIAPPPTVAPTLPPTAPGYFKGGQDSLICPDDDTLPPDIGTRSSYGFLSKSTPNAVLPAPAPSSTVPATTSGSGDLSQSVWNYWGYRSDGYSYASPSLAKAGTPAGSNLLVNFDPANPANPANFYNQQYAPGYVQGSSENLIKYSMSNRFAPPTTIITHCLYHRLPTANGINAPGDLYVTSTAATPIDGTNAKEIILRIDGSAKAVDVSQWLNGSWQKQTP